MQAEVSGRKSSEFRQEVTPEKQKRLKDTIGKVTKGAKNIGARTTEASDHHLERAEETCTKSKLKKETTDEDDKALKQKGEARKTKALEEHDAFKKKIRETQRQALNLDKELEERELKVKVEACKREVFEQYLVRQARIEELKKSFSTFAEGVEKVFEL